MAVEKELNLLKDNSLTIPLYLEGMSALYRSGVFSFLRAHGRVILSPKDTQESVALNGAYAAGYQDALDLLFTFKERLLDIKTQTPTLTPDFGGSNNAVTRGDLTKEEAYGLKRNK